MVYTPVRRDNPRALAIIISSVDLAHYGVSRAKDCVSMNSITSEILRTHLDISDTNLSHLEYTKSFT